jgi:hypothetical protein
MQGERHMRERVSHRLGTAEEVQPNAAVDDGHSVEVTLQFDVLHEGGVAEGFGQLAHRVPERPALAVVISCKRPTSVADAALEHNLTGDQRLIGAAVPADLFDLRHRRPEVCQVAGELRILRWLRGAEPKGTGSAALAPPEHRTRILGFERHPQS